MIFHPENYVRNRTKNTTNTTETNLSQHFVIKIAQSNWKLVF